MNSKSRMQKGKRFEILIAKEIEAMGLGLARRESGSGSGLKKGDIAANLPFLIEAKNQAKIKINEWVDQAKSQAKVGNYYHDKWALIFKDPRTSEAKPNIYAVIDFWEFLKLLKKDKEPMIKKPDREMSWRLRKLIADMKILEKMLK